MAFRASATRIFTRLFQEYGLPNRQQLLEEIEPFLDQIGVSVSQARDIPPGRARLATSPVPTGSGSPIRHTFPGRCASATSVGAKRPALTGWRNRRRFTR